MLSRMRIAMHSALSIVSRGALRMWLGMGASLEIALW
jgi:hypothetical protein